MVTDIAADGNEAVDQRREGAKGDKCLFLRETKLFNKEHRQDALDAVIAKTLP